MSNPEERSHWERWHDDYSDPDSALSQRLAVVTGRTREAVDALPPGPIRLISACAGQGHDVMGALHDHPRAGDVVGRLVESDQHNSEIARLALAVAGLRGLECVRADAGLTDAYAGAVPADVLLLCGIFGNVSDDDVRTTVVNACRLCAPGAFVIWTRHRREPDLTPAVRRWFVESGFEEAAFDSPEDASFAVGTQRLVAEPLPFESGRRLFTFVE